MGILPKNRIFDVEAKVKVFKDGKVKHEAKILNPVFYPSANYSIYCRDIEHLSTDTIITIIGAHNTEVLQRSLKALRALVKHGKFKTKGPSAKVLSNAIKTLGLEKTLETFICTYADGRKVLNLEIEIHTEAISKFNQRRKLYITGFKYRIMRGNKIHAATKWRYFDVGDDARSVNNQNEKGYSKLLGDINEEEKVKKKTELTFDEFQMLVVSKEIEFLSLRLQMLQKIQNSYYKKLQETIKNK